MAGLKRAFCRVILITAAAGWFAGPAYSAEEPSWAGMYEGRDRGWKGRLEVGQAGGMLTVRIRSESGVYACRFEGRGRLVGRSATVIGRRDDCKLGLKLHMDYVKVSASGCRAACGLRGTLAGKYYRLGAGPGRSKTVTMTGRLKRYPAGQGAKGRVYYSLVNDQGEFILDFDVHPDEAFRIYTIIGRSAGGEFKAEGRLAHDSRGSRGFVLTNILSHKPMAPESLRARKQKQKESLAKALRAYEKELEQVYQRLTSMLGRRERRKLAAAHKEWLKSRDRAAAFLESAGDYDPTEALALVTKGRIGELKKLLKETLKKKR